MKKALILLPVIALTACDKPTSTADLTCDLDKNWQRDNVEYAVDAEGHFTNTHDTKIDVRVVTYEDYADVTVDKITTKFEKVQEEKNRGEFGHVALTYKGNFPGSERTALLSVYGDITNKQILQYDVIFLGKKAGKHTVAHSCYPVKEEYKGKSWSSAVPFNHHYKMPNKTEKCITEIVNKVICNSDKCDRLILSDEKSKPLSQEEALLLSKNWNYNDMKYYRNDGKLEEHEKDACEVLERIKQFVIDNGLDNHDYKAIQKAMDDCGDECRPVLVTGEMGDFLIKLPATDELRKIANKQKNAKFLSVFNPNSYAKTGYCLINIIPYSTMEKMGDPDNDCNYRIYCGAPEFMNYDEFYAVEVCH